LLRSREREIRLNAGRQSRQLGGTLGLTTEEESSQMNHEKFMCSGALALAARGLTNPHVGCVIAHGNLQVLVGVGTRRAGAHARRLAGGAIYKR
jgi:hypothetical protein